MWYGWAVVAGVILLLVAFSDRLGRWSITAPMVFVALGGLVSESGLDLVTIELDGSLAKSRPLRHPDFATVPRHAHSCSLHALPKREISSPTPVGSWLIRTASGPAQ